MNPTTPTTRRLRLAAGSAVLALALAACGSSGSSGSSGETSAASTASSAAATTAAATTAATAAETTAAASAAQLKVSGAWARTSAAMQDAGAAYLKIENTGDTEDALVSAKAPETVAMMTQIHEVVPDTSMGASTTAMSGDMGATTTAMGGSMDSSATTMAGMGAMKMQEVDKIVVPAKGSVELKPGGYHIMLMKLAKPLVKGETFDVTLTFASGATQVVSVEVRDEA